MIAGYRENLLYQEKSLLELNALSAPILDKVRYVTYEEFYEKNKGIHETDREQYAKEAIRSIEAKLSQFEIRVRNLIGGKKKEDLENMLDEVEKNYQKYVKINKKRTKLRNCIIE